jgi:hypothetical protein
MIAAFRSTIIRPHDTEVFDLDHTNSAVTGFLSFDSCALVSDLAMSTSFCNIASFARSTIHKKLARSVTTPECIGP